MPKYIIERKISGLGASTNEELQKAAQRSNDALRELDGEVQWLHSYVVENGTFCVYVAPNEAAVRRHAQLSGFPADRIVQVDAVIDPATGESTKHVQAA